MSKATRMARTTYALASLSLLRFVAFQIGRFPGDGADDKKFLQAGG